MPVPTLNGLPPFADFGDMKNKLNSIVGEINNLLVSLDTLNIVELNAKVITAGSITGDKIQADSITSNHIQANAVTADEIQAGAVITDKIQSGAVTADKITVSQLSAIAADLGHITAGLIESIQIFGSYIATRNGSYPRAEMSNSDDLFAVYLNANEAIKMQADYAGAPSFNLIHDGNIIGRINMILGHPEFYGKGGLDLNTDSGGDIYLSPANNVTILGSDFSRFKPSSGTNLQTVLDGKATAGISTSLSGSANGGIPIGTQLMVDGGGTVTWTGIPTHSHAQN